MTRLYLAFSVSAVVAMCLVGCDSSKAEVAKQPAEAEAAAKTENGEREGGGEKAAAVAADVDCEDICQARRKQCFDKGGDAMKCDPKYDKCKKKLGC